MSAADTRIALLIGGLIVFVAFIVGRFTAGMGRYYTGWLDGWISGARAQAVALKGNKPIKVPSGVRFRDLDVSDELT